MVHASDPDADVEVEWERAEVADCGCSGVKGVRFVVGVVGVVGTKKKNVIVSMSSDAVTWDTICAGRGKEQEKVVSGCNIGGERDASSIP